MAVTIHQRVDVVHASREVGIIGRELASFREGPAGIFEQLLPLRVRAGRDGGAPKGNPKNVVWCRKLWVVLNLSLIHI